MTAARRTGNGNLVGLDHRARDEVTNRFDHACRDVIDAHAHQAAGIPPCAKPVPRVVGRQASLRHDEGAIGKIHVVHLVGGEENRAPLRPAFCDERVERAQAVGVERGGGLVEQQRVRVRKHRDREPEALQPFRPSRCRPRVRPRR